jgi:hypothetical protein
LSSGAYQQVQAYKAGRNGLASNGADYHPRPNPIPVFAYYVEDASNVNEQWRAVHPKALPGVRLIQRALVRRGYDVVVDGILGPQTKGAFKRWSGGYTPTVRNLTRLGTGYFRGKK